MRKKNFLNTKSLVNGWIHSESSASAEIMGASKFNSITIDLQHGETSLRQCKHLLQILSRYKIFKIVRVPSNEIGIINKVLDFGANGVICPLVNSKEECIKFLSYCYYPPKGIRSYGPTIASIEKPNYFQGTKDNILSVIMIETRESVSNLEQILSCSDLDMVYVGPYDLSISFGYSPDKVFENNKMKSIYIDILDKCKKYKKKVAIHCSGAENASFFLKKGFNMVTISTDLNILKEAVLNELHRLKL